MKKIEDYLHLYFGCQCDFRIKLPEGFSVMPYYQDLDVRVLHNALSGLAHVKPILRPLSDMTEDETAGRIKSGTLARSYNHMCAEETKYLLSRHFDLFGLIDADLAIDKTKM